MDIVLIPMKKAIFRPFFRGIFHFEAIIVRKNTLNPMKKAIFTTFFPIIEAILALIFLDITPFFGFMSGFLAILCVETVFFGEKNALIAALNGKTP